MVDDARLGTELAGHRIERIIGRGGASVVYLAEHVRLGRLVALKLLAPHLADDAAFRERFIRESRIAAGLDHPSVVTVYDAGEADGILYLSMRYVAGTDLGRLLDAEGAMDPWRTVLLLRQVAGALDAAHEEGLVHRDVKPGNILLEASDTFPERAFLSDFGVTKRITSRTALTRTGQFVGTVDYVAPEQIAGDPIDGRADVYSLGCVLYHCLSGRVPFPRDTDVATIYGHLQDPPPPLPEGIGTWPGLDTVVARALAKHPDDRYATCTGLVEAARNTIGAATVTTERTPLRVPAERRDGDDVAEDTHVREVERTPTEILPGPKTTRRPRRAWPSLAIGGAVVASLVIWMVVASGGAGSPPPSPHAGSSFPAGSGGPAADTWRHFLWHGLQKVPQGFRGSGEQAINDLALSPSGVVAVGHAARAGDPSDVAIWMSPNGQRWRSADAPGLHMSGEQRATTVGVKDGVILALGWTSGGSDLDAMGWRSTDDGTSWTPVRSPSWAQPGDQVVRDVVVSHGSFVAVGYDASSGEPQGAAWRSSDGLRWRRMQDEDLGGVGAMEVDSAVVESAGVVVATGSTSERGDVDPAFWVLRQGDWTRANDDPLAGPGNQIAFSIAAGRGSVSVAVGYDDSIGSDSVAVWRSVDGRTWERVAMTPAVAAGEGPQRMLTVTAYRGGFVAAGHAASAQGDVDGAAWISVDGVTWARGDPLSLALEDLGGPSDQELRALVTLGGSGVALLGAGVDHAESDENAAVWGGFPQF